MSDNYRSREERKQAEKAKQEQKKQKSEKPRKKGSFFKKFLITCLLLGIIVLGAGVSTFYAMIKDAPKIDEAKLADPVSTKFYDKDGGFIHEYGVERRTPITYDQIPKVLEDAFLSTEDARFYEHHGIDIKRTAKAIFENLTNGFGSQGGSTITQQVIKNSFLSRDKNLKRKVQEWYLAYKLEQKYSKHEILEMYLNKINLGNYSWGIAAAAKNYYGIEVKDLKNLTLPQAAMLAGLPQLPNAYNPSKPENEKEATKRRNLVLTLMHRQGAITEKEMKEAMQVPVREGVREPAQNPMPYQAFLDAVAKEVEGQLKDVNIGTDGLKIYTTLDPKAQAYAEQLAESGDGFRYPNDQFQTAFVFQDTKTGEVRAIASGRKENKGSFRGNNYAIDLDRQPGSTFKPILAYGPAIEHLKWATSHTVEDKETKYDTGAEISNWDNKYHGIITIRKALEQSYNIPALLTMREVGKPKAKVFAENLGITFANNTVFESYVIGANQVSPIEMSGAYSAFGNNGVYIKPHFVTKVVFPDGKEVNFKPKEKRAMADYTAYIITDMLRSVVKTGTGTNANVSRLDVAGKTGTTNFDKDTIRKYGYPADATNDSWFVGYTPQYTMSVWTGYAKNGQGMYLNKETSRIAQYIFKNMMSKFGTDTSPFEQPSTVYRFGNELGVTGGEKVVLPKEKPDTPTGVNAQYDTASNTISLKWSYTASEEMKDVSFDVAYSLDGGSKTTLTNTKSTSITLGNVKAGGRYTFFITATANGKVSDEAKITVTVTTGSKPEEKPSPPDNGDGTNQSTPPNTGTPPSTGTETGTPPGSSNPGEAKPPAQSPLGIP
ncbi:PBP1A family penicillin-binding protein [Ectobacillus antri]|uniref:PBP1A family penicillin-binding protein n=1 Tax=Ectobacillus antri TaxID=2486280 RepID=A0ABT6H2F3_9BACI|nr:PBP1A family penicillin-binding protein [Ectobacillus antri]MDG4656135.1 PBP1A family penicillin-binding protein [Ectobacillus antri]MDG5752810.1 PBP1A family penicillin-binding protein [Ectobacillus antri]